MMIIMNRLNDNPHINKMRLSLPSKSSSTIRSDSDDDMTYKQTNNMGLPPSYRPTSNTVILGRGKACANSMGNRRLQSIVKQHLDAYLNTQNMQDKADMISRLVDMTKTSNPNGASFVKRKDNGTYWEVSENEARGKVRSMFRTEITKSEKRRRQKQQRRRSSSSSTSSGSYSSSVESSCKNTDNGILSITNIEIHAPEKFSSSSSSSSVSSPRECIDLSKIEDNENEDNLNVSMVETISQETLCEEYILPLSAKDLWELTSSSSSLDEPDTDTTETTTTSSLRNIFEEVDPGQISRRRSSSAAWFDSTSMMEQPSSSMLHVLLDNSSPTTTVEEEEDFDDDILLCHFDDTPLDAGLGR